MNGNTLNLGRIIGTGAQLDLSPDARSEQVYGVGMPRTGKSKLLEHCVRQDILNWPEHECGILMLDPHGEVFRALVRWLSWNDHLLALRPIVLIDLESRDYITAYNPLRERPGADPGVIVRQVVESVAHVAGQADTQQTLKFSKWASDVFQLLYANGLTLLDAFLVLDQGQKVLRRTLLRRVLNPLTHRNFRVADDMSLRDFEELIGSTVHRLHGFAETQTMQAMFGQSGVSFDFDRAVAEGWIVLVNLSTKGGMISVKDQWTVGTFMLSELWSAAGNRGKGSNKPFYLYVDEFQRFLASTIAEQFAEARGFGLHGTFFHQYPSQLMNSGEHGKRIFDAVTGSAGNLLGFRTRHPTDGDLMAKLLFTGTFNPDEIKYVRRSKKVLDYVLEMHASYGEGFNEINSVGGVQSLTDSHSDGRSSDDEGREIHSEQDGHAHQQQSVWNKTTGRNISKNISPLLRPILGYEEHPEFRSLEEQVFRAMAALFDQKQRQAAALVAGSSHPVAIEVPFVDEPPTTDEMVKEATKQLMRWPFQLRREEAIARVEARKNSLIRDLRAGLIQDEPKDARGPAVPSRSVPRPGV